MVSMTHIIGRIAWMHLKFITWWLRLLLHHYKMPTFNLSRMMMLMMMMYWMQISINCHPHSKLVETVLALNLNITTNLFLLVVPPLPLKEGTVSLWNKTPQQPLITYP